MVFPVPGLPVNNIPFGSFPPRVVKCVGSYFSSATNIAFGKLGAIPLGIQRLLEALPWPHQHLVRLRI